MEQLQMLAKINYGSFALKAMAPERIIGKQIEAARVALTRHMKRQGSVGQEFFLIFQFQKNLLKYVWEKVKVHLNIGLVELNQEEFYLKLMVYLKQIAKEALYKASAKLPIKTKFIKRFA